MLQVGEGVGGGGFIAVVTLTAAHLLHRSNPPIKAANTNTHSHTRRDDSTWPFIIERSNPVGD